MNVFKDLTNGFSTFVLAWLVPSTVASAVLVFAIYPVWADSWRLDNQGSLFVQFVSSGPIASTAAFALLVVILALTSSLASRALYRFLEGYTFPKLVARPLLRRQHRRMRFLQRRAIDGRAGHTAMAVAQEQLSNYPSDRSLVLPTRLGNSLRALEKYGTDHYGLDSQSLYYEMCAAAPAQSMRDLEEARAPVDFFISFTGLLTLLSVIGLVTSIANTELSGLVIAVVCLVLARAAYLTAVQNMTDYRYAMQSMINISRVKLAESVGYDLPQTLIEEIDFWQAFKDFMDYGDADDLSGFDSLRGPRDCQD